METKQQIIKQFLKEILKDIEQIDDGCKECINLFCYGVNKTLIKDNLKLTVSNEYPIKVNITELTRGI